MGTYRIIQWLATNAVSELFLGRGAGDEGPERPVLIERLLPAYAREPDFSGPFLRAARTFATLHHPNVVRVLEQGEDDGRLYRILEYVDGESLRSLLAAVRVRRLSLGLREVCFIVGQVAEGLDFIHARLGEAGVSRRPCIHPSQVRLGRGGEVKLMDVGGGIDTACDYLSPEQALGRLEGLRGELFRLGLLLYELLAGQPLFDGDDPQVLQRIGSFDVRSLEPLPGIPPALWSLLRHTLRAEPEERPGSAREVADALCDFLLERELSVGPADLVSLFARAFPERRSPLELLGGVPREELSLTDVVEDTPQPAAMPSIVRTAPRPRGTEGPPPVLHPVGDEPTNPIAEPPSGEELSLRLQAQHSRLLDDALSLLGGSAALAPLLVRLTRGCVTRLGASDEEEALAVTAARTLALASRLEEPRRFVLPTLTRVRGLASGELPELKGILSSVLLSGKEPRPSAGLIARSLQCAAAFVVQVQQARPGEAESVRALGVLSQDSRLLPAAVEALAAELGVEPPVVTAPTRVVSPGLPPTVSPCEGVTR